VILVEISSHINHTPFCENEGLLSWNKGLVPSEPKGFYCCANFCLSSSRGGSLTLKDDHVVVHGVDRTLGTLDDRTYDAILKYSSQYGYFSTLSFII
jgi:hypothetical protein